MTAISAIVMGGSAGALTSIQSILKVLPADFAIPILLVQHRAAFGNESLLVQLLSQKSPVPVREARDKDEIKPGVTVAPADYHVVVDDATTLSLSVEEPVNFSRPAIDVLFESAAHVFGKELVGILLSGASRDGSLGVSEIKRRGGTVLVEDPAHAESRLMPLSAIERTAVDFVLPPDEIGTWLSGIHAKGLK